MAQSILHTAQALVDYIGGRRFLLVCDAAYPHLALHEALDVLPHVTFADFTPNPLYEQVYAGIEVFRASGCEMIVAVGGGSAMDVAKCIALYSGQDPRPHELPKVLRPNTVPLAAVPTTAGTGSESTRHAVIYLNGVKQSVSHPSIVPDCAALLPEVLDTLPLYQKKCTMLDALCQAIESWWSVSSTEESIGYSRAAITAIRDHWQPYLLENDRAAAGEILHAANLAGRAINITATTAAHAMSYKLTSRFGLPHGHAVAVCMTEVWTWLRANLRRCSDPRGEGALRSRLSEIEALFSLEDLKALLGTLEMNGPVSSCKAEDVRLLTASVNPERLHNMPCVPDAAEIAAMYERIVNE